MQVFTEKLFTYYNYSKIYNIATRSNTLDDKLKKAQA